MSENSNWFVKTANGVVYGPAEISSLVKWAQEGRVEPTSLVSVDKLNWKLAPLLPELEMKWLVEVKPGDIFGPFNRNVVVKLFKDGSLSTESRIYRMYELPPDMDVPKEKEIVEKEVRVEVPVEKVVEKIVEVPVEKLVEKEVRIEVPVEKIVEKVVEKEIPVEKIVEKEIRVEVPVEKVVEKIVEVPVEKFVEKEVRVEVPVEKIVEKVIEKEIPVEKIVEKEVCVEVPVEKIV